MSEKLCQDLFEHNIWANNQIIQACITLSDEQLDARPQSFVKGSIRQTLLHLVGSQQGYLSLLTLPIESRKSSSPAWIEVVDSAKRSGEALLAIVRGEREPLNSRLQTMDGYYVEPWVVLVQVINHATEHREQIKHMLSTLGIKPPNIDGWAYGEIIKALSPISEKEAVDTQSG